MAITDIYGNVIPTGEIVIEDYYEEEMADTIAKVRDLNDEPALVFPVATDIHRYSSAPQTFDKMIANMTKFAESVKCDFVTSLGDLINGDTTQANSLSYAYDSMEKFQSIGVPYLNVQGNHDNNPYDSGGGLSGAVFNIQQVFKAFFTDTKGVTYNFSELGTDYYIDFDGLGVRVIVLNACNVKGAKNYAYGSSTGAWLATALDTNHTVLLLVHLSPISSQVWNNCQSTNTSAIKTALQSFVNNGGHLVQLSGHTHLDLAFVTPWLSVVHACTRSASTNTSGSGFNVITGYIDEMGNPSRTQGTYTEDLWTVCVLKPNSGELDCIRFGAGNDRYFHYVPIAPTTLTTRLSNVTWSSSDTSVATVSDGVVTGVASGTCAILAKDAEGNYEAWTVTVS